jgi:hypothetical protein
MRALFLLFCAMTLASHACAAEPKLPRMAPEKGRVTLDLVRLIENCKGDKVCINGVADLVGKYTGSLVACAASQAGTYKRLPACDRADQYMEELKLKEGQ